MGILSQNVVKLSYDVDAIPTLRCPMSGKVILQHTPEGDAVEIKYSRIKTVLFSLLSPMIGNEELDYFRKDFRTELKNLRKSMGQDGEFESNSDLLDRHFADWPSNVMVFEITLDGMHGECHYIGIDMGPESLETAPD